MLSDSEVRRVTRWSIDDAFGWRNESGHKKPTLADAINGWLLLSDPSDWGSTEIYKQAASLYTDTWLAVVGHIAVFDGDCERCGDPTGGPSILLCHAHQNEQGNADAITVDLDPSDTLSDQVSKIMDSGRKLVAEMKRGPAMSHEVVRLSNELNKMLAEDA